MSLPMLAAAALILRMTAAETAQWFGISFVMHLVYGLVLGLVVRRLNAREAYRATTLLGLLALMGTAFFQSLDGSIYALILLLE